MLKVLMLPHIDQLEDRVSGIARVVEAYFRHLPDFGIRLVEPDAVSYDVKAVHAGMTDADCTVCHCHGLYWTADYDAPLWEYQTNARVIAAVRHAREVTVPSSWVAETFQRDMRFTPHIIPHGIEWEEWQHDEPCAGYVLWNKNRATDVCDPSPLAWLAGRFPEISFVSTQPVEGANVRVTGLLPPKEMKKIIQRAGIYLATTKETFGIGILEAMASGVPVLGFAHGGALDLVEHGVSGYLAAPGNLEDLADGLGYCLRYRDVLGENAREVARTWTWERACQLVAKVYRLALRREEPTVAIVIPSFNYGHLVSHAIRSAMSQTYPLLTDIIIVDDGSEDDGLTERTVKELAREDRRVQYIRQNNAGVAVARNRGIESVRTKYVCCLDADDTIEPVFLEKLIPALEADSSLGVAFSSLMIHYADGRTELGFQSDFSYDEHLKGIDERGQSHCQVPTCCVFRRKAWERLGGYRQRYAPSGCGTEDAEFWLRMGAFGWGIQQVTREPLFHYTAGGRTTEAGHITVNYTEWHPWAKDGQHPFASIAKPKQFSHPVQYYEPLVSVVIPVGPGHEEQVVNALDFLEAQTFRKWEAIVVWDSDPKKAEFLSVSYPYARLFFTSSVASGASHARNLGASQARAPYLLFLDADDWLDPECLAVMTDAEARNGYDVAVYTDYICLSHIEPSLAEDLKKKRRLLEYRHGHAASLSHAFEYDPARAMRQPDVRDPYLWCLISTLLPAAWFHEVGGFNETLESYEDWEFWLKLARRGKAFVRVPKPLVVYRMDSGRRREEGAQNAPALMERIRLSLEGGSRTGSVWREAGAD